MPSSAAAAWSAWDELSKAAGVVRIGAVFPQNEIGPGPGGIRAFAEGVQELGFDHLLAFDHVLGADRQRHAHLVGPYRAEHLFHEILVVFGYVAAIAPGLELVTGVVIAPQRQTALLAKQAAEIDVLTGGRFRCGLGIGWNDVEYEALGMSFTNRGRRFEEQIELLRRLWTEPVLDFEGRWHTVTAAGINPLPVRQPIPIWIGGSAEPALRRAARLADGYFPQRPLQGGWAATLEQMRGWLEEAGRDPDAFGIDARVAVGTGTPDEWRAAADEWRSLGATHVTLNADGGGLEAPDAHLERLQVAMEVVR
jgi:probable F420-dependent oxidoreductase